MERETQQILIIEDDEVLGGAICQRLGLEGFQVFWAQDCAAAVERIRQRRPDFIVSDIILPDGSGEDVFRKVQPWLGDTPILFATAFGEIDQAVRLVKAGAEDYLTKPYDVDALIDRIRGVIAGRRKAHGATASNTTRGIVVPSNEELVDWLHRAGKADLPVLLMGETGVGKEIAARYLHSVSPRKTAPFVAVNCAAIPHELLESQFFGHVKGAFTGASETRSGFFAEAGVGTLFLDEIGELDPRLQAALLRVLEDGGFRPIGARAEQQFKGRIVAATNAELGQMRQQRLFREDLYYRLSVLEIEIEPLRARPAEIIELAKRFLSSSRVATGEEFHLSEGAQTALLSHEWPGNIRELRNRLQRAQVFAESKALTPEDIFPEVKLERSGASLAEARHRAEIDMIEKAVAASGGRIGDAAKSLGISRTTLWKRRSKC